MDWGISDTILARPHSARVAEIVVGARKMQNGKFIEAYATYVEQGTASVFIGAGVSVGAGYPNWPDLVREMAEELDLDLQREPDLASVVQFFLNRQGKVRARLTNIIQREIGKERPVPNVLRILARLPLRHIWTTNYDTLHERAWREQRKLLDVKSEDRDLVRARPGSPEHGAVSLISSEDGEN
jgi:hypothetical protein